MTTKYFRGCDRNANTMNKNLIIGYNNHVSEVVASSITLNKLKSLGIETLEICNTFERPLSFRVIADKYLCSWLNTDYKQIKQTVR